MSSTPSRERPLDEVKDRVVERWRDDEIAARLKEKAEEAVEKLKTASVADVAAEFGSKPQFIAGLKRDRSQGEFPADALDTVFQTGKDQPGTAEGAELAMDRVPRHRHHRAAARHGVGGSQAHRRPRSRNAYSRTSSRNISRGCRPNSAPPSTKPRSPR